MEVIVGLRPFTKDNVLRNKSKRNTNISANKSSLIIHLRAYNAYAYYMSTCLTRRLIN